MLQQRLCWALFPPLVPEPRASSGPEQRLLQCWLVPPRQSTSTDIISFSVTIQTGTSVCGVWLEVFTSRFYGTDSLTESESQPGSFGEVTHWPCVVSHTLVCSPFVCPQTRGTTPGSILISCLLSHSQGLSGSQWAPLGDLEGSLFNFTCSSSPARPRRCSFMFYRPQGWEANISGASTAGNTLENTRRAIVCNALYGAEPRTLTFLEPCTYLSA